jgi:hypothetical protein
MVTDRLWYCADRPSILMYRPGQLPEKSSGINGELQAGGNIFLSYIYLGYFVCLCVIVCVCVCVTIAERSAIRLVLVIKLTKEMRRRAWRERD